MTFTQHRAFRSIAVAGSLLFHLLLLWWVSLLVVEVAQPRAPLQIMLIDLPKPLAKPKPIPRVLVKPIVKPRIIPRPVRHQILRARAPQHPRFHPPPPPPRHFQAADDSGLDLDLAPASSGTANGSDAMAGYDDAVKSRVLMFKTYPQGIKGMWEDCAVSYTVTVDRKGQLVNYHLDGCGNPFIDSAALAAILKASPYPVPPDFGGDRYEVSGSLIYRQQQ